MYDCVITVQGGELLSPFYKRAKSDFPRIVDGNMGEGRANLVCGSPKSGLCPFHTALLPKLDSSQPHAVKKRLVHNWR